MLDACLLDFDGTITEPFFDWKAIRDEMGIGEMLVLDAIRDASGKEKKRLRAIMERHEEEAVRAAKVQPGAKELIAWLEANRIKTAVITNNRALCVTEACKKCGICFQVIIGRECGYYKPSPEMPLIAAKMLGSTPKRTAVVGDSRIDMESARSAGMVSILVGGRNDIPADHYAKGLPEALEILKRLHSGR